VLTRLPPPHRAEGDLVRQYLSAAFPAPLMTLSIRRQARLIDDLVALGISGGASYDAVVAMIAAQNGSTLATLDRRAQATYDRVGVGILALRQGCGARCVRAPGAACSSRILPVWLTLRAVRTSGHAEGVPIAV
jgi:hypothetical protein